LINESLKQPVGVDPSSVVRGQSSNQGSIGLGESLRIALDTLMANKLRTGLTALGVIIGVAAVVALLALGRGSAEAIAESITKNGANLLTVRAGSLGAGGFGADGGKTQALMHKQTLAIAADRHGHRQFRGRELEGELVFLGDLGVGPARRPVELEHPQRAVLVTQLIDAIFVAVERKQSAGRLEADALRGSENRARMQVVEWRACRIDHSHHRTLM